MAVTIEGDGADSSLFVAAVMLGGMCVFLALLPGCPLGFADQFLRLAELHSLGFGEALRAFSDEHHVRTVLENLARELNGILDALQSGGSAGAKRCAVHDDGVAFDGGVFENDDGGFDGVKSGAAALQDGPTRSEGGMAAGFASFHGFVRNVPRAAMNNESRFHRNEDGKGIAVCLANGKGCSGEKKLNAETQRSQRGGNHQTKKSRTKRSRPIRRSMGPPLIQLRGKRLSEWKKEISSWTHTESSPRLRHTSAAPARNKR